MDIQKLMAQIVSSFNSFADEAGKCVNHGNASAGRRARKTSLELEKQLKEFRKLSVK